MANQKKALAKLMKQVDAYLRSREDEQVAGVTQYYKEFSDSAITKLEALLRRAEVNGSLSFQDFKRMQLDKVSASIVEGLIPRLNMEVSSEISKSMATMFQDSYLSSAWSLDQVVPNEISIDQVFASGGDRSGGYVIPLQEELAKQYIAAPWKGSNFSQRIGVISDTMARDIQTLTTEAAVNGQSVSYLASSLRDLVGVDLGDRLKTRPRASRALYRADTIARTELMRMMDAGSRSIYNQNSDLMNGLVWSSAPGPSSRGYSTCEDCEARDGMTDEEIKNNPPDDMDLNPPAHPRCRCRWLPHLKSDKELMGKFYGEDMKKVQWKDMADYELNYYKPKSQDADATISVQPFDEWVKEKIK